MLFSTVSIARLRAFGAGFPANANTSRGRTLWINGSWIVHGHYYLAPRGAVIIARLC
jgi:hypothetical protein